MSDFTASGRLANASRVRRLILSREGSELSLLMTLDEIDTQRSVDVRFHNVSDLRFRGERTLLTEIVLLLAEDVSARAWERVRFEVKDAEEEFISLLCERVEIEA
jgi:hypothetical protein